MKTGAEHTTRRPAHRPEHALINLTNRAAEIFFIFAAILIAKGIAVAQDWRAVEHFNAGTSAGDISLVAVDLSGGMMEIISTGTEKYSSRANFESLARKSGAMAAINGCFFDMKSGKLVGHIYDGGVKQVEGSFGAAFAVDLNNKPVISHIKDLDDPKKYKVIISCVDILMKNGKVLVDSKSDLVKNGHNPSRSNDIYKAARWSAIGIGRSGRVYFVGTKHRMSIYRFVKEVAANTEISDLLGLDGGTSSGLYVNGGVVIRPARTIPSIIAAVPAARPPAFASALTH